MAAEEETKAYVRPKLIENMPYSEFSHTQPSLLHRLCLILGIQR